MLGTLLSTSIWMTFLPHLRLIFVLLICCLICWVMTDAVIAPTFGTHLRLAIVSVLSELPTHDTIMLIVIRTRILTTSDDDDDDDDDGDGDDDDEDFSSTHEPSTTRQSPSRFQATADAMPRASQDLLTSSRLHRHP